MKSIVTIAAATCALIGMSFAATSYPVSGKWTYESATNLARRKHAMVRAP